MSQSDQRPIPLDRWEACARCGHGAAWHAHPTRSYWSQGALRRKAGIYHGRCGKEGCPCTFYEIRYLSGEDLRELTRRIRAGWRGKP
jgi:hypothetical protein